MANQRGIAHTGKPMKWIKCTCSHDFQEQESKRLFGSNEKRLHNPAAQGYRCTVCLNMKAY